MNRYELLSNDSSDKADSPQKRKRDEKAQRRKEKKMRKKEIVDLKVTTENIIGKHNNALKIKVNN